MVGRAFREHRRAGALALVLAFALVGLQFALVGQPWAYYQRGANLVVVLVATIVLWRLAGRDAETLGLRLRVEPSPRYWLGGVALVALAVGAIVTGYLWATGRHQRLSLSAPDADAWRMDFPDLCLFYPVYEELVYRVALCSALVAVIGRWPTVVASGAIFALAHVAYGTASPDNFVAGYFLAWAYLRSGSVALPIAMHAAGNLVVFLLQPRF